MSLKELYEKKQRINLGRVGLISGLSPIIGECPFNPYGHHLIGQWPDAQRFALYKCELCGLVRLRYNMDRIIPNYRKNRNIHTINWNRRMRYV